MKDVFTTKSTFSRSNHLEVFLRKGFLKICSKFTGEHPWRSAISVKLHSNFIEIALRHGCFPVNLMYIFRVPFLKSTSGWLLLIFFDEILSKYQCGFRKGFNVQHCLVSIMENGKKVWKMTERLVALWQTFLKLFNVYIMNYW